MAKSPEVAEDLRAYLSSLNTQFELTFSYNGTDYKTVFNASHVGRGTKEETIHIENGCIDMDLGYFTGPPGKQTFVHGFMDGIRAEDGTIGKLKGPEGGLACFNPILTTNERGSKRATGKRTTSGDVLKILQAKLALAFPVLGKRVPVQLVDASRNEASDAERGSPIMISPFHLCRGGDAYYEKYGFRSSAITKLKEGSGKNIRNVTWRDCTPVAQAVILDCTGKKKTDYRPGDLLADVMKGISWDDERAYNERPWDVDRKVDETPRKAKDPAYNKVPADEHHYYVYEFDKKPSLSSIVFREFAHSQGFSPNATFQWSILPTIWTFELDTESEDWARCDKELVLTGFSTGGANPVGGAGKGRRSTRRARRNKRRSTRRR